MLRKRRTKLSPDSQQHLILIVVLAIGCVFELESRSANAELLK
jgi:hypothetical protein